MPEPVRICQRRRPGLWTGSPAGEQAWTLLAGPGPRLPRTWASVGVAAASSFLGGQSGFGLGHIVLAAVGWRAAVDREQRRGRLEHPRTDLVTEPHDWPLERPGEGTLRPWYLTATGYLVVLFGDPEEARRAHHGLLEREVPAEEVRLYESDELYDRRADSSETTNLANDAAHAALLGDLRSRVLEWLVATSDVIPPARDPRIEPAMVEQLFPGASKMWARGTTGTAAP